MCPKDTLKTPSQVAYLWAEDTKGDNDSAVVRVYFGDSQVELGNSSVRGLYIYLNNLGYVYYVRYTPPYTRLIRL